MSENTYEIPYSAETPLSLASTAGKERFFLRHTFNYYLTLSVIATTLLSWLNLNSYLIILLLLCRLFNGSPRVALRAAFTNIYFWAFSVIFLIELAGLLYTHNLFAAWKHMESKATLVAIPFIFLAGPFTDNTGYRKLLTAYCLLLAGICLYCLSMAVINWHWQHDVSVFFYHELTASVGVNAVFFSGYVLVAILFLLFTGLSPVSLFSRRRPHAVVVRGLRIALVLFFTGMLFLLSSRQMLMLMGVAFIAYAIGRRRPKMKLTATFSVVLLIALVLAALAFTDNPFSRRYRELSPRQVTKSFRNSEPLATPAVNGISLRLFMWRAAFDILDEQHAWAIGVSGGDSQYRLDQKYMDAGLSQGYLGYNFHNEYIEVLVHSGLIGWALFMLAIAGQIALARAVDTPAAMFTTALVLVLCATESALEMQHGLFLCCFFPLLHLCRSRPSP
jgi:O-antigen ligase